jgi:methionine-rich copper-binding protein CopC
MSTSTLIARRTEQAIPARPRQRYRPGFPIRPSVESLECRALLNASTPAAPIPFVPPNETINLAQDLGTPSQPSSVWGSIGNGPDGASDVTWYHFRLDDASQVALELTTPAGDPAFAGVLSLFNNDPQDFGDPYDLDGHRMLAPVDTSSPGAVVEDTQDLGPGDYYLAIGGVGNLDFSPAIADSGLDGSTGDYELTIAATDLGLSGDGPTVIASDPAPGSVLDSSPPAIRLELSGPLDPNTIIPGQTVQLLYNPDDPSGNAPYTPVALASVNFSAVADELQLFPEAPLEPGNYVVSLAGNSSEDPSVLADPDGIPLGENAQSAAGADESISFQVDGVDGVAGATTSDDTPATARDLGDVVGAGLVQVSGSIGVDPSFNPELSADPTNPEPQFLPANQVDLYHFQVTGPGRYAAIAEVFAGRIGSPLDPGISLWELDPGDDQLVFLAGNNNTLDPTQGTDGSVPLFTDSELTMGLTAGDYYLAVADGSNTPSPIEGQPPGSPGLFDPNQIDSAQDGYSTGAYVLNLLVQPAPTPPRVVSSSPTAGQVLDQAPTQITVRFSEAMDIQELAFQAFEMTDQETLPEVFIVGSDGTTYYPRFLSYDTATNVVTFQMLDGLGNGSYTLHLSGPGGLADLGGNPLVGDDPSGDDVIPFVVQGPGRTISGKMTVGYTIASQGGQADAQPIGVLFPDELQAGVTIARAPESATSPDPDSMQDEYAIQFLQNQIYAFKLSGNDLPPGIQVSVESASGQVIDLSPSFNQLIFFAPLAAGPYTIIVSGWFPTQSESLSYQLVISFFGEQDHAPPLVDGPAPALQVHLEGVSGSLLGGSSPGAPSVGGVPIPTLSSGYGAMASSGESGALAIPIPGPSASDLAQVSSAGELAGLGMGPLGGASNNETSLSSTAAPVQVALAVPTSPVFDRLGVSLLMLTRMIDSNPGGEGTVEAETDSPLVAAAGDRPVGLAAGSARSDEGSLPDLHLDHMSIEPSPMAIPRLTPGREILTDLAEAVGPASRIDARDTFAPDPETATDMNVFGDRDEPRTTAGTWTLRLVIGGAILAAANRVRDSVRGLEWRKRACARESRSEGSITWRRPHADATRTPPEGETATPVLRRFRRGTKAVRSSHP